MTRRAPRLLTLLALLPSAAIAAQAPAAVGAIPAPDRQVAAAVLALPATMRDSATVLGYREAGSLVELRRGANGMICLADNPADSTFHVACYHESLEPFMARGRALRASGVTGEQVDTVRFQEIRGHLRMPAGPAALHSLSGPAGSWNADSNTVTGGRALYVVYIPFATPESTGIPAVPAPNQPWLMFPGTPKAHIMFAPRM
jgi:hypothetical protein